MPITECWDILSVKPRTYSSLMLGTPYGMQKKQQQQQLK